MLTGPVTGEEFFDRKGTLASLVKNIRHSHHALIGLRGCGKSSILQQLATMKEVNGFAPVYFNIAHVVPRTHRSVIKVLGREALYGVMKRRGLIRSMPALVADGASRISDFVRDHLRVKIGDWVALYFDPNPDLTDLMRETFETIESYGMKLVIMMDEISSLVRLAGPQPRSEDMDFMESLREHMSEARNARYILSGSHLGIMRLMITVKFGRHVVPIEVGGLEEEGADEFIRAKLRRKVPEKLVEGIKNRTKLLPLYLRAYCHAINISSERPKRIEEVDETVFGILHGHLSFLAGQLSDREIMLLCALDEGKVSDVAAKLDIPYDTVLSFFRVLELKGFVRRTSPGKFEATDPIFSMWLKREYGKPEEWR